jgi:hypothetical protein
VRLHAKVYVEVEVLDPQRFQRDPQHGTVTNSGRKPDREDPLSPGPAPAVAKETGKGEGPAPAATMGAELVHRHIQGNHTSRGGFVRVQNELHVQVPDRLGLAERSEEITPDVVQDLLKPGEDGLEVFPDRKGTSVHRLRPGPLKPFLVVLEFPVVSFAPFAVPEHLVGFLRFQKTHRVRITTAVRVVSKRLFSVSPAYVFLAGVSGDPEDHVVVLHAKHPPSTRTKKAASRRHNLLPINLIS